MAQEGQGEPIEVFDHSSSSSSSVSAFLLFFARDAGFLEAEAFGALALGAARYYYWCVVS